jgi:hypothetical protein
MLWAANHILTLLDLSAVNRAGFITSQARVELTACLHFMDCEDSSPITRGKSTLPLGFWI